MGFFKNLFSERTFRIIVGTCICIVTILFTLVIIEQGFTSADNELPDRVETLKSRLDKNDILFYRDTVNGNAFQFKDLLVIPWVEMQSDSLGKKNTILNFKVYNMSTKKEFNLFPENQRISNSKLIQIKERLIWQYFGKFLPRN